MHQSQIHKKFEKQKIVKNCALFHETNFVRNDSNKLERFKILNKQVKTKIFPDYQGMRAISLLYLIKKNHLIMSGNNLDFFNPNQCGLLGGVLFGEMKFVLSKFLSNENLSIS